MKFREIHDKKSPEESTRRNVSAKEELRKSKESCQEMPDSGQRLIIFDESPMLGAQNDSVAQALCMLCRGVLLWRQE